VNPAISAVANKNPASLTAGLTPINSTNAIDDVVALMSAYTDAGGRLESAVFLLSSRNVVALRLIDSPAFEQLTPSGGAIAGIPALASDAIGSNFVLVDRARVLIADDGDVDFRISTETSWEMRSDPTMHGGTGTSR